MIVGESMNIYVASSWKNLLQPIIVRRLREQGHEVYDFHGSKRENWKDVTNVRDGCSALELQGALRTSITDGAFADNMQALMKCDACVLVLPCGLSAHLEAGWAAGNGKQVLIYFNDENEIVEPELMYKTGLLCVEMKQLLERVGQVDYLLKQQRNVFVK
jgi:hypothetical protein